MSENKKMSDGRDVCFFTLEAYRFCDLFPGTVMFRGSNDIDDFQRECASDSQFSTLEVEGSEVI